MSLELISARAYSGLASKQTGLNLHIDMQESAFSALNPY